MLGAKCFFHSNQSKHLCTLPWRRGISTSWNGTADSLTSTHSSTAHRTLLARCARSSHTRIAPLPSGQAANVFSGVPHYTHSHVLRASCRPLPHSYLLFKGDPADQHWTDLYLHRLLCACLTKNLLSIYRAHSHNFTSLHRCPVTKRTCTHLPCPRSSKSPVRRPNRTLLWMLRNVSRRRGSQHHDLAASSAHRGLARPSVFGGLLPFGFPGESGLPRDQTWTPVTTDKLWT